MLNTLPKFLLVIAGCVIFSLIGIMLVRRGIKIQDLKMHHDVTDPILAVLGTLFAILIGFMLANSMQRFEAARVNIEQEAGSIGDVFRLVDGLPPEMRDKTRKDCMTYVNLVIEKEWLQMQKGKFNDEAWEAMNSLWYDALHYQPQTQAQSNIHQELVASISRAGECRRTRLAELSYGLPHTLWFIVIFGGISTIAFTYFFAVTSLRMQILMTSVITTVIGLNVYMLAGYDSPFNGDIALTPAPFLSAQTSMQKAVKLVPPELNKSKI